MRSSCCKVAYRGMVIYGGNYGAKCISTPRNYVCCTLARHCHKFPHLVAMLHCLLVEGDVSEVLVTTSLFQLPVI